MESSFNSRKFDFASSLFIFWFSDTYQHKPFSSFKNLTCAATDSMITEAKHYVYCIFDGHAMAYP